MAWLANYWSFARSKQPAFGTGKTVRLARETSTARLRMITSMTNETGWWWVCIEANAVMRVAEKDGQC